LTPSCANSTTGNFSLDTQKWLPYCPFKEKRILTIITTNVSIMSIKVITIAVLLYGADRLVLSVYLWSVWDTANPGEATALSVLLVIAVGTLTPIDRRLAHSADAFKEV
jgi:ABC-type Fe3+ transport system permease subunit